MFQLKAFPGGYSYRIFVHEKETKNFNEYNTKLPDQLVKDISVLAGVTNQHRADSKESKLAKTIIQNLPKDFGKRGIEYTHFISIPLGAAEQVESFISSAKKLCPSIRSDAFMAPRKFHLTICMLTLSSPTEIDRVISSLSGLELFKRISIQLKGLDVMKGSVKQCQVLYAKVVPNALLDELGKEIVQHLAAEGFIYDFKPIKWHATLINVKYCHEPNYTFDATEVLKSKEQFGQLQASAIHLCDLKKAPDAVTGYYHTNHKWELK